TAATVPAAAPVRAAEPAPAPVPVSTAASPDPAEREEEGAEPAFAGPSLFEAANTEPEAEREHERVAEDVPAWQQFLERSDRRIEERDEPEPAAEPPEPAPWVATEPTPAFISEPEAPSKFDDAWRLPDDQPPAAVGEGPESAAFPHPPPMPVPEPSVETSFEPFVEPSHESSVEAEAQPVVIPPLAEHADWDDDNELYRAPPEASDDDVLQHAPEAPPPEPDIDAEEREARRRQQEEAARA